MAVLARPCSNWRRRVRVRTAFTLVELLVVIAIIGVLLAMILPAVQAARESARRTQCAVNLRDIGLALQGFADAQRGLPVGSESLSGTQHAWSTMLLPYLEEGNVYDTIDLKAKWNSAPGNEVASRAYIGTYRCPSGIIDFEGKQDYGGVQGTALTDLPLGMSANEAFGCGVLIVTSPQQSRRIALRDIVDGLSATICVGESVDRNPDSSGRWACGSNCFSQNSPHVNTNGLGDLLSRHPRGAHAAFADAHVSLLNEDIDPIVLGGLCTRNGGEVAVNALGNE